MNPIDTIDPAADHPTSILTDRPDDATARPPSSRPPISHPARAGERPWPTRARALFAGVALLAVLGLVGTIIGLASGGSDPELEAIRQQVQLVLAERDAAIGAADELDGRISILEARLGASEAERDRLADELETAGEGAAALEARIADLDATVTGLHAEIDAAASARDAALAEIETLEAELTTARQQAAQAIAERDALVGRFPLTVDPSIDVADVVGSYRLSWQERFCSGLAGCGTVPKVNAATIRSTTEGYLRIELGSIVTTNLSRVSGGLHAVAGSTTALPACDGATRPATVTLTLYPDSWSVARDGSVEIRTWGGAVTMEAAATRSCPAALAFYSLTMTTGA